MTWLSITKVLTWCASPFGCFVVGLFGAALLRWRRIAPRLVTALSALSVLQLIVFSLDPVADAIIEPLEQEARRAAAESPREGYASILLLGGGISGARVGSNDEPRYNDSVARVFLAARLYREGLAPRILASGGSFAGAFGTPIVPEAEVTRDVLVSSFGIPREAIVIESASRTTRENAIESIKLLGAEERIAVVTSAFHMPRALAEMRLAGLHAFAFPSHFQVRPDTRPGWEMYLPNPDALRRSSIGIKEWLGRAVIAVRSRLV